MGLYEVPLSMSLLGFGMGTMLANFHMCGIMLVLSVRVVIFILFYYLLDLSCSECDVISLYFVRCSVGLSVCLVCCVFDSVCELFGETIRNIKTGPHCRGREGSTQFAQQFVTAVTAPLLVGRVVCFLSYILQRY